MKLKSTNRRQFLQSAAYLTGGLVASQILRPSAVFAQTAGSGKNVILVNLVGGFDGLAVLPYATGVLADNIRQVLRANISIAESAVLQPIPQGGMPNPIGFNPGWARLVGDPAAVGATIPNVAAGNLRILKTVGYSTTDPGRSHDTTSNIYSIGRRALSGADTRGWLARLMDLENWESFQLYGIGTGARPDLNSDNRPPIVIGRVSDFRFTPRNFGGGSFPRSTGTGNVNTNSSLDSELARKIATEFINASDQSQALNHLYKSVTDAVPGAVSFMTQASAVSLTANAYQAYNINDRYVSDPHNYTGRALSGLSGFQGQCQDAARVLIHSSRTDSLNNKMKVVYLTRGGWDSHSNQRNSIGGSVADVAAGLAGLVTDLKANGLWNDTVILVFSEFGRTKFENSIEANRAGTDHAYANFHLVLGGSVRQGVTGDDPTAAELITRDRNYLRPSNDFRQGLKEILTWAGISNQNIQQVLPEAYPLTSPVGIFT